MTGGPLGQFGFISRSQQQQQQRATNNTVASSQELPNLSPVSSAGISPVSASGMDFGHRVSSADGLQSSVGFKGSQSSLDMFQGAMSVKGSQGDSFQASGMPGYKGSQPSPMLPTDAEHSILGNLLKGRGGSTPGPGGRSPAQSQASGRSPGQSSPFPGSLGQQGSEVRMTRSPATSLISEPTSPISMPSVFSPDLMKGEFFCPPACQPSHLPRF